MYDEDNNMDQRNNSSEARNTDDHTDNSVMTYKAAEDQTAQDGQEETQKAGSWQSQPDPSAYSQPQNGYGQPNTSQQQNGYSQPNQQGRSYVYNPYAQNPKQPYGQYSYSQNGGQNPYGYYQNQGANRGSQQTPNHNTPKKKRSILKTTAMVTAAALLFGTVSGATMFGVNRAANLLFPAGTETAQTQASLESTPVLPAKPQSSTQSADGVVIEDVSAIVDAAMPSVVAITNTMLYKSNSWFGPSQTYEVPSSGSGIIVGQNDSELLIVTNNHVIEDSNSLSVTFIDESTVDAAIKGTDSASDLAVIAVPLDEISADTKTKIKAATLGDSGELKMGQGVIAIGNALGLGQSVTVGHVSALDREITVDGNVKKVIQTDAAINPGNSGGALLNSKGELIGINEAKYADEKVEGIGYAIPINFAKDIIDDLKLRTTKVEVDESEQGYLGITVQNIDSATAQMYGMPEGVYVYKITENSAASESDLREKDIITKFDGETVRTNADLTKLLAYYKAGTEVTLTVQSLENGTYVERQVTLTLKHRPKEDETQASREDKQNP